ncbi:MAG: VWA domain-containing protein [Planctomycetes bacterium]|nr:VWA domain-containing protein [Planctomycetota bacterium]
MFALFSIQYPVILFAIIPIAIAMLLWSGRSKPSQLKHSPANTAVFRGAVKTGLRLTCVALLLLALSSPSAGVSTYAPNYTVFLMDISESVPVSAKISACEKIRTVISSSKNQKFIFYLFAGKAYRLDSNKAMDFFTEFDRKTVFTANPSPARLSVREQIFYEYFLKGIQKGISAASENGPPAIDSPHELRAILNNLQSWENSIEISETRLGNAINLACAGIEDSLSKKILVFTDGWCNETAGETNRIIFSHPDCVFYFDKMDAEGDIDVIAKEIYAPIEVKVNEPFDITVAVSATAKCEAAASLFINDELYQAMNVFFAAPNQTANVTFSGIQLQKGNHTIKLLVETQMDSELANNSVSKIVSAIGKPRVLILEDMQNASYYLKSALDNQDFTVETRTKANVLPLHILLDYDCVVLFQLSKTTLNTAQEIQLERYVREYGGSVFFIAGPDEANVAALHNTLTEQILPCNLQDPAEVAPVPQDEKPPEKGPAPEKAKAEAPTVAMMLILDKSGSMEGTKLQLVKESAIATAEALYTEDLIGVIAFDSQAYEILPLTPAREKDFVADKISRITADGGTEFFPALNMAYKNMSEIEAKIKHVVLLSDGHTALANFKDLVAKMTQANITLTAIGIGEDFDSGIMANLSQWGKGRFYFTYSLEEIPQIFTKETTKVLEIASEKRPDARPGTGPLPPNISTVPPAMKDIPVIAADADAPVLKKTDTSRLPPLQKIITVLPKNFSNTILFSDRKEPVLIFGRYGLGKTAAWAGDLDGAYSEKWLSWDAFPGFISAVTRSISRVTEEPALQPRIAMAVDRINKKTIATVFIPEEYGGFTTAPQFDCFYSVNDRETECAMERTATATYQTAIPMEQTGIFYYFNIFINAEGFPGYTKKIACIIDYPGEFYNKGANSAFFDAFPEEPPSGISEEKRERSEKLNLSLYLLVPALFMFLADITIRRGI